MKKVKNIGIIKKKDIILGKEEKINKLKIVVLINK